MGGGALQEYEGAFGFETRHAVWKLKNGAGRVFHLSETFGMNARHRRSRCNFGANPRRK
jgi:hypothetical protein